MGLKWFYICKKNENCIRGFSKIYVCVNLSINTFQFLVSFKVLNQHRREVIVDSVKLQISKVANTKTRQKGYDKYFGIGTCISLSHSDRRKDLWSILTSVQAPNGLNLTKERTNRVLCGGNKHRFNSL